MRLLTSRSVVETRRIAGRLLRRLGKRHPLVLALSGELGSGKTMFIQGLARALGVREKVQSPTFVLAKWYQLPKRAQSRYGFRHFIHVDAYRLESIAEARRLGLGAIFGDRDAVVVIEWADRIRKLIPRSAMQVRLKHSKRPHERVVAISE